MTLRLGLVAVGNLGEFPRFIQDRRRASGETGPGGRFLFLYPGLLHF